MRINESEKQLDFFRKWRNKRRMDQAKMKVADDNASQNYLDGLE